MFSQRFRTNQIKLVWSDFGLGYDNAKSLKRRETHIEKHKWEEYEVLSLADIQLCGESYWTPSDTQNR